MVLARVFLTDQAAHRLPVRSHDNKQIFGMKSEPRIFVDDLDMGQTLLVGADFVLAFDDQHAVFFENAVRLLARAKIEIEHGGVVARADALAFTVGIMAAKRAVITGAGHVIAGAAVQTLHVRRGGHRPNMTRNRTLERPPKRGGLHCPLLYRATGALPPSP